VGPFDTFGEQSMRDKKYNGEASFTFIDTNTPVRFEHQGKHKGVDEQH
jgi:hypothetical protein